MLLRNFFQENFELQSKGLLKLDQNYCMSTSVLATVYSLVRNINDQH